MLTDLLMRAICEQTRQGKTGRDRETAKYLLRTPQPTYDYAAIRAWRLRA
jgi:hypothetical protein